jgi:mono/diheme cytochrome c family protein
MSTKTSSRVRSAFAMPVTLTATALLLSAATATLSLLPGGQAKPPVVSQGDVYKSRIRPLLDKYCIKCHGVAATFGNLRLDTLSTTFSDAATAAKWHEVLNVIGGHQMPPAGDLQPTVDEANQLASWLETQLAAAETAKRSNRVVLRRMNRAEYNNTIRDLMGVDFQPADSFPDDPPAGGFDNIGQALTISPLHMELYYAAARQIVDKALVEGSQPAAFKWHFEPEENKLGMDQYRVKRDGFNVILNDGANPTENGFTRVHHASWDKGVNFRDFRVPVEGEYILRFRGASRVPNRAEVLASAERVLGARRDQQIRENPKGKQWHDQQYTSDLEHFRKHRMYTYGPARVKVTRHLGSQPDVIAELDVPTSASAPGIYEIRTRMTTQQAGFDIDYAYDIPSVLENYWLQGNNDFARPELLVDWVELEGPVYSAWPPKSHAQLLGGGASGPSSDETIAAKRILEAFMPKAYRRPVTPQEVSQKLSLFTKSRPGKKSFVDAIKVSLVAILASPDFLFLTEPFSDNAPSRALNAYELASRLSYFLWSSMPDDALFKAAANGSLLKPGITASHIDRMLRDPKASALTHNFTGQWLGLRKVGANPPAHNLYPEYDRHLETSMVRESEAFFDELLHNDVDLRKLIKSDFVVINERMARFYDIPGVKGDAFRRVPVLPEHHRGGIVTQASIQTITSNGTRTSPVTRGVWILKTLLGQDPGLPVANVGEIATKVPGIDKATVRQRLEIHRKNPACARCHDKIDPLGFALENYNACGEWRVREGHGYQGRIEPKDPIIDASAKMPDGASITGVAGLQDYLMKNDGLFLQTLTRAMATYALGRELGVADKPLVDTSVVKVRKNGMTLRSLIHAIVDSREFRTK